MACTKTEPKNDLFLHCRRKPKQLSKKELSNVAPALVGTTSRRTLKTFDDNFFGTRELQPKAFFCN